MRPLAALLARTDGVVPSMEAIAGEAGVTRATVYNHFTSRAALISAVLSDTVRRHDMDRLVERSQGLSWNDALTATITTCAGFWNSERELLRCLFAIGSEEPDVIRELRQREACRTKQFAEILAPANPGGRPDGVIGVVMALTSVST